MTMKVIEFVFSLQSLSHVEVQDYERACNALELSSLLDPLFIQCLKNKNSPFILPLVQRLLYILRSELKVLETLLNENEHIAIKILHEIKDLAILSRENDVFKLCLEIFNTYAQNAPNLMSFINYRYKTHLGKYSSELRGNDALFQIINSNYIREVHASVLIQKYWRGYSYKKRYNVMLRGFMALQRLFMMKRSAKELAKWTKLFEKSDTCFLKGYQSLVGRRLCHEGRYSYISTLSPKKFRDYQIGEQGRAATQIQNFWKEVKHKKINLEFEETRKRDSAARTIQKYACKWLLCKQKKYQWSKTLFSPTDLSKDKIKSIQDEINFFQKTLGSKVIEKENFIEKYNESQWRFAKFQLSLNRSRLSEHRISARLAQSITICELISNPPGLDVYDPERDWKNFHTLSLPAATASRIEHKATIEDFEAPKWKDAVNKCIEQYYDLP
ncbi:IQ calmodulin-binding motif-containing protein 1 isoform X2 [Lepeophtheirus salmonis]|uniref:IQ calmodulin-binding motif-containing protein 1 isoform X2 n=1 Tax=Lepeophtheirus salmonis TaxID=72036 RepID=UPI001AE70E99|nr:IQ calmodulin-binding motif-containing protein 1-like isoform X2 [Lepeophtheirus salmonis]